MQKAFATRNNLNKLLFDVVVIDKEIPTYFEVVMQGVQFEVASTYVEDYNYPKVIN